MLGSLWLGSQRCHVRTSPHNTRVRLLGLGTSLPGLLARQPLIHLWFEKAGWHVPGAVPRLRGQRPPLVCQAQLRAPV